jgi:hypothetical protein
MGDVLQAVFGGSSKKSSSKPIDLQSPELKALRGPFAEQLTSLMQQGGRPAYEGPFVAGITPEEQEMLRLLRDDAAGASGRQDLIAQTIAGRFLPGGAGQNPFLEAAIAGAQRPTAQALNDTLTRALPGTFTKAGHQIGGGLRSPNPRLAPGSTAFDLAAARAFEGGANAPLRHRDQHELRRVRVGAGAAGPSHHHVADRAGPDR